MGGIVEVCCCNIGQSTTFCARLLRLKPVGSENWQRKVMRTKVLMTKVMLTLYRCGAIVGDDMARSGATVDGVQLTQRQDLRWLQPPPITLSTSLHMSSIANPASYAQILCFSAVFHARQERSCLSHVVLSAIVSHAEHALIANQDYLITKNGANVRPNG